MNRHGWAVAATLASVLGGWAVGMTTAESRVEFAKCLEPRGYAVRLR